MTTFSELINRVDYLNFSMTVTKDMLRDFPYLLQFEPYETKDNENDLDSVISTICDKKYGIKINDNMVICNKKVFTLLPKFELHKVNISYGNHAKLENRKVGVIKWARQKYHSYRPSARDTNNDEIDSNV